MNAVSTAKMLPILLYSFSLALVFAAAEIITTIDNQIKFEPSPESCSLNSKILQDILTLLKSLESQGISHFSQPDKKLEILSMLRQYLEKSAQLDEVEKQNKLKQLISDADNSLIINSPALRQRLQDENQNGHNIQANFEIKYDIPNTSTLDCNEAMATLTQTVNSLQLQLINYCNLSGQCKLNKGIDQLNVQNVDITDILNTGNSGQAQIRPFNTMFDIQSPTKHIDEQNYQNQLLTQKLLNNMNTETNIFNKRYPSDIPHTNTMNNFGIKNALNNLEKQQFNHRLLIQKGSNRYISNDHALANSFELPNTLNSEDIKNRILINQEVNSNIYNVIDKKLATGGNLNYGVLKEPLNHLPVQHYTKNWPVSFNNEPNILNDPASFYEFLNRNQQELNRQSEGTVPINEHHSQHFQPSENLDLSNAYSNLGFNIKRDFSNTYRKPIIPVWDNNVQDNPNLNSIFNINHSKLKFNSHQADAVIQGNNPIISHTSAHTSNYPRRDIYGRQLLDSNRLNSMSKLLKLNSPDSQGTELNYLQKGPQAAIYNPNNYFKYALPSKDFVPRVHNTNNPLNFKQVGISELSDSKIPYAYPDFSRMNKNEVSQFILRSRGTLVPAKVLGENPLVDNHLKTVQNLNAKLNTNDILSVVARNSLHNENNAPPNLRQGSKTSYNINVNAPGNFWPNNFWWKFHRTDLFNL